MTFFFLNKVLATTFAKYVFLSNLCFKRYCSDIGAQWIRIAISVCLFFLPTERGRERSEPPWRLEIPYTLRCSGPMLKSPSSAVIHANLLGFEFFVIKRLHFVGKCQNILNMSQFKHSKIHLQHWLDWAADKLSLSQFLSSQLSAFYSANFFDYFRLSRNSFSYFTVLI